MAEDPVEKNKRERKEREAAEYEQRKKWARGRDAERKCADAHFEKMLFVECKMQFEHWKKTVTED